jgi:hypothetical protein
MPDDYHSAQYVAYVVYGSMNPKPKFMVESIKQSISLLLTRGLVEIISLREYRRTIPAGRLSSRSELTSREKVFKLSEMGIEVVEGMKRQ